jgi:hypothetical protein
MNENKENGASDVDSPETFPYSLPTCSVALVGMLSSLHINDMNLRQQGNPASAGSRRRKTTDMTEYDDDGSPVGTDSQMSVLLGQDTNHYKKKRSDLEHNVEARALPIVINKANQFETNEKDGCQPQHDSKIRKTTRIPEKTNRGENIYSFFVVVSRSNTFYLQSAEY